MAPQDDLTAERAAATLLGRMGLVGHPADAQFIGDILEFRRQTRQEALREAKQVIEKCFENGPSTDLLTCGQQLGIRAALIAVEALDRLASEGG